MTAALDLSLVPPLGEPRPQPAPVAQETTLSSGLRVVVVPRPGVPLIDVMHPPAGMGVASPSKLDCSCAVAPIPPSKVQTDVSFFEFV